MEVGVGSINQKPYLVVLVIALFRLFSVLFYILGWVRKLESYQDRLIRVS